MPFTFTIMTTKLTIDKAGRVVIPKKVRDKLHMSAGDAFEFKSTDDQIVLKPMREEGRMFKKRGMWVFHTGKPLSAEVVDSVIQSIREERDRQNMGLE